MKKDYKKPISRIVELSRLMEGEVPGSNDITSFAGGGNYTNIGAGTGTNAGGNGAKPKFSGTAPRRFFE